MVPTRVISERPYEPLRYPSRPSTRSLLSAANASVISASSAAWIAVRTAERRKSSSAETRALMSVVPLLPSRLVMVCALSTGFGDVEHHQHAMAAEAGLDFAQRSGQYRWPGASSPAG